MSDFSGTFKDANGDFSSKRVLSFLAFALFSEGFVASQFGHAPPSELMSDLVIMILGGLGLAAAEWFGKGNAKTP